MGKSLGLGRGQIAIGCEPRVGEGARVERGRMSLHPLRKDSSLGVVG